MAGVNPYIAKVPTAKAARPFHVTFIDEKTGEKTDVAIDPAKFPFGQIGLDGSLLDIATEAGVQINHTCGGVCACSTCHVYVQEGLGSCSKATEDEEDQIDKAPALTTESRLSCQCVPNGTQNIVVLIPRWNRNQVEEAHQGINSTNQPGGFGTALYPATTTGTRGGQGGRAGAASSSVNTTDPGGILAPLPRQIAYASQIQFKLPPGAGLTQLQTDLRGSIDRIPTTMLANPAGVKVEVDGRSVVLRGSVRDEEESHLVEGMIRLTPGVGAIKNELAFPK